MNMMGAVLFGVVTTLMATTAGAQTPSASPIERATTFGGQSITVGPRLRETPLIVIGGLAVGIWSRVPPPYDVAANRNATANPLP